MTSCFLTWKSHSTSLNSHATKETHLIMWGMHTMFSQWLYFFYIVLSFPENWPSLTQAWVLERTLICTQVLLTLWGLCSEPRDTSTSCHGPTQRSGCPTPGPLIQAHWPVPSPPTPCRGLRFSSTVSLFNFLFLLVQHFPFYSLSFGAAKLLPAVANSVIPLSFLFHFTYLVLV